MDGAPTKAESQEFAPELGGVAASLAPAASKEGFERVENAVARWLRPGWCPSEPEPAMHGLAVGAELGGDAGDRRADPAQPRGLLVSRLPAQT